MVNYIGEIKAFAGATAPRGWNFCYGQLLSIAQYQALFTLLGTSYGGDGRTTFALPDLRGNLPVSQGNGLGLSGRIVGQTGGSEKVTLLTSELPAHNHSVNVSTDGTSVNTPGSTTTLSAMSSPGGTVKGYLPGNATGKTVAPMNGETVGASPGSGQPHNNMMPSLAINYIIALEGIFPSRT